MTIDEISNFCEFKDVVVSLGSPETGFIAIDGSGLVTKQNNYRRFLMLHELASLPAPRKVLSTATLFQIHQGSELRELDRSEFEAELQRFQALVA